MPTAMPDEPLTRRFGNLVGRTVGSCSRRRSSAGSQRSPFQVTEHFGRDLLQTALGVAHRRRVVAVHRAKVALTVDQRVAQRKVLRHPHQSVINRTVAMRVKFAHHVAHDAGALDVGPVVTLFASVHAEQHAAVHRLETARTSGSARPTITLMA
jgi:hypothetical protein